MKILLIIAFSLSLCHTAIAQNKRFDDIRLRTYENIVSNPAFQVKATRFNKPILKEKPYTCTAESIVYYDRYDSTNSSLLFVSTTCGGELVGCDLSSLLIIDTGKRVRSETTSNVEQESAGYSEEIMPLMMDSGTTSLLRGLNNRSYKIMNEYIDPRGRLVTRYSKKLDGIILYDSINLICTIDTALLLPVAFSEITFGASDSSITETNCISISLLPNAKQVQRAIIDSIETLRKSEKYTRDTTTFTHTRMDYSSLIGKKFPDIELMDTSHKVIKLSSIQKKYIVVDLWYITCAPCLMNIATLNQFHKNFKDSADVTLIGIDPYNKNNLSNVKKVIKRFDVTYPTYVTDIESIEELDVHSFPTLLILDKDLTILKYVRAPYPGPAVRELLAKDKQASSD